MDQRGHQHLQPLTICNRLYNFIMKLLATQASKTVTLGCSTAAPPPRHFVDDDGTRADIDEGKSDAFDVKPEEAEKGAKRATSSLASLLAGEARGPLKKSVSINERVEEIDGGRNKKMVMLRRKGSSEKINPFEGQDGDDKPLRSILKVGSMSLGGE